jgi:transcriptional regulator with GAF, ATPase, and Fis domain
MRSKPRTAQRQVSRKTRNAWWDAQIQDAKQQDREVMIDALRRHSGSWSAAAVSLRLTDREFAESYYRHHLDLM